MSQLSKYSLFSIVAFIHAYLFVFLIALMTVVPEAETNVQTL